MERSYRSTIRRLSAPEEALDEALRRGSFGALLSGLLLAIAFPAALFFVPEHAKPAWDSIKRDVVFFVKNVAFHPSAAAAGSAPVAKPPEEILEDRALEQHVDRTADLQGARPTGHYGEAREREAAPISSAAPTPRARR